MSGMSTFFLYLRKFQKIGKLVEKNGKSEYNINIEKKVDILDILDTHVTDTLKPITDDDLGNIAVIEHKINKYLSKHGRQHFNAQNQDDFADTVVEGLQLHKLIKCSNLDDVRFVAAVIYDKYKQGGFSLGDGAH